MKIKLVPVATGTVLEKFSILEDDIEIGFMQRERRPPLNPRGVWVSYPVVGAPLGQDSTHKRAVRRVVENYPSAS